MRILLTGTTGQVGAQLQRSLSVLGDVICPGRAELDLGRPESVAPYLARVKPQLIVNPAAYTAVDKAETEPAVAFAVNRDSPNEMARWCHQNDVALVHYSTDYVYPGDGDRAFAEDSPTGPTNVYGQSKLAGDLAIAQTGCAHWIFRTSWVYDAQGKNFLNTMLRLAQTHPTLRVVADQVGAPTPARLIADVTLATLSRHGPDADKIASTSGTYHLAPTGHVSWHGFAQAIMAHRHTMTGSESPLVLAITTPEFPTPAARPANSRLALDRLVQTFGIRLPSWEEAMARVMEERLGKV